MFRSIIKTPADVSRFREKRYAVELLEITSLQKTHASKKEGTQGCKKKDHQESSKEEDHQESSKEVEGTPQEALILRQSRKERPPIREDVLFVMW